MACYPRMGHVILVEDLTTGTLSVTRHFTEFHLHTHINTGWWFGTFLIFHFIYGMSSFPRQLARTAPSKQGVRSFASVGFVHNPRAHSVSSVPFTGWCSLFFDKLTTSPSPCQFCFLVWIAWLLCASTWSAQSYCIPHFTTGLESQLLNPGSLQYVETSSCWPSVSFWIVGSIYIGFCRCAQHLGHNSGVSSLKFFHWLIFDSFVLQL